MGQGSKNSMIRASEIGEYVFCARAWKLRLDGHSPTTGQAARVAGEAWHRRHGRAVRRVRRLNGVALACFVLALMTALVLLLGWSR